MSEQKLLEAIQDDPYNDVSAHALPDGGIQIMLSHRITMDAAVLVRIPPGDNIRFLHDPDQAENVERTNLGGPWVAPGEKKLSDEEALDELNLLLSAYRKSLIRHVALTVDAMLGGDYRSGGYAPQASGPAPTKPPAAKGPS